MEIAKAEQLFEKIVAVTVGGGKKEDKLSKILKMIIKFAGVDQTKYFILGSYAIRKHREISDLDINMESSEWDKLRAAFPTPVRTGVRQFPWETQYYNDQWRWYFDLTPIYQKVDKTATDFSIEIFRKAKRDGFPNSDYSLHTLAKHDGLDVDKNGHQFFSLQTLLSWKKTMNRSKDLADIELIQTILDKSSKRSKKRAAK
jgi:hypothetical protein